FCRSGNTRSLDHLGGVNLNDITTASYSAQLDLPTRANCSTAENTAEKQRVRQQMLVLRECRHPCSSARIESRMGTVAWAMRQRSVSDPRSSNWKCGFPASGCPTGFTVRYAAGLWNVQELQIVFQSHEITVESQ